MNKWTLAIALALTASAYGAEPSALLKCSAIEDSVKRLACFDSLVKTDQKNADQTSEKKLQADEVKDNETNDDSNKEDDNQDLDDITPQIQWEYQEDSPQIQ